MNRIALAVLAIAGTALVAAAASTRRIPRVEQSRMHALLAPYDFYPANLPAGLIYINWRSNQLSPMACGKNLAITFAGTVPCHHKSAMR